MALDANELFSSATRAAVGRAQPFQHGVQVKTLQIQGTTTAMPFLTPMAVLTASGEWDYWDDGGLGGLDTIRGFMFELEGEDGSDANERQANILLRGVVHLDDIQLIAGNTLANLKTALRTGVRERGLIIDGLDLAY